MKTKILSQSIIATTLLVLLMGSSPSFAVSHGPLVLNLTGAVTNAGSQAYSLSGDSTAAGQFLSAQIAGNTLTTAQLTYSLNAVVTGMAASGLGQFSITTSDNSFTATGSVIVLDTVPAIQLPLGCAAGSCTSEVPAFFVGVATIDSSVGGAPQPEQTNVPFVWENAYLSPYGGPLIMGTADILTGVATPAIALVATYTTGTIQWSGGVTAGTIDGTISTKHDFTGQFSTVSQENEDLVAGTAVDSGTVTFFNMNNAQYNAKGTYSGTSFIPSGGIPCGAPFPPGTCMSTGFQSTGSYNLQTDKGRSITGAYDTTWSDPAYTFTSTVTAALGK